LWSTRRDEQNYISLVLKFFKLKLDLTYMFYFLKINLIFLYLQQDKIYGPRKQISRIMGYDHSLDRNDIIKFMYCSMIWFLI
jgi:hypothetical protein